MVSARQCGTLHFIWNWFEFLSRTPAYTIHSFFSFHSVNKLIRWKHLKEKKVLEKLVDLSNFCHQWCDTFCTSNTKFKEGKKWRIFFCQHWASTGYIEWHAPYSTVDEIQTLQNEIQDTKGKRRYSNKVLCIISSCTFPYPYCCRTKMWNKYISVASSQI